MHDYQISMLADWHVLTAARMGFKSLRYSEPLKLYWPFSFSGAV